MSLDEQVKDDAWAKNKSGSLLAKFGRWVAYAGLAASAFTGVSYMFGARWAQEVRANFDVDYAHWIDCERLIERDYEEWAERGYTRLLNPIGIDLRLSLARFIFDSELPKSGAYIAASRAYYTSRTFSNDLFNRYDVSRELISDADVLIELYKFRDTSPDYLDFIVALDSALASHSWSEVAEFMRVK